MTKTKKNVLYRYTLYDKASKSRGGVESYNKAGAEKLFIEKRGGVAIPEGWEIVNRGPVEGANAKVIGEKLGAQANVSVRQMGSVNELPDVPDPEEKNLTEFHEKIEAPSYLIADTYIMIVHKGVPRCFHSTSSHYHDIKRAIDKKEWGVLAGAIDAALILEAQADLGVRLTNGVVTYKGDIVHNVVADRILALASRGKSIAPMVRFLENLLANPLESAQNELYLFMEKNDLPITEDGCFLAYKRVDRNYMDCRTHTIDNHVGNIIEMDRDKCDTNRNNECSYGLHFCSQSYLSSFSGGRTVIVKINPMDVVAIPKDYSNAKGRCCRYTVVDEITNGASPSPQAPGKYVRGGVVGKHVFVEKGEFEDFSQDKDGSSKNEEATYRDESREKLSTEGLTSTVKKTIEEVLEKVKDTVSPNVIRMVRQYHNLTPRDVYEAMGISESAYRRRESVSNRPKSETINETILMIIKLVKKNKK